MSEIKKMLSQITRAAYNSDRDNAQLKEVLDIYWGFHEQKIKTMEDILNNTNNFYIDKETRDRDILQEFLELHETNENYSIREIVFQAINDVFYNYTYVGNNLSRDLSQLSLVFQRLFLLGEGGLGEVSEEAKNKLLKGLQTNLMNFYLMYEEKETQEKLEPKILDMSGEIIEYEIWDKYVKKIEVLDKIYPEREVLSFPDLVLQMDKIRAYDKHRIEFQERLLRKLYSNILQDFHNTD